MLQNQPNCTSADLRGKLLHRIAHQTFFSAEKVSANPGAVQSYIDVLNTMAREAIAKGDSVNITPELAFNNLAEVIRRKKKDK